VSGRFNATEYAALAANTTGAILAVLGKADWVAITVAIASVAMQFQDYFYIPRQLEETNRAFHDIHNLLTYWDSLSLVQRKTPATKRLCAGQLESTILALVAAKTAVSPNLPNAQEDGGDDEEK